MTACSDQIVLYMHEYLDGDLTEEEEQFLQEHLQSCSACQNHFQELNKTVDLLKAAPKVTVSSDFTNKVIARLPKERKTVSLKRWMRLHPFLVAASLFLILMAGSIGSIWTNDQKFSFTKQPNLIVENDTVIVPPGEVVDGDLVVKNGNVRIEGKVNGNVTIINGEQYLASAGNVTGEIKEIDEIFEWIWFKMKESGKQVINLFEDK